MSPEEAAFISCNMLVPLNASRTMSLDALYSIWTAEMSTLSLTVSLAHVLNSYVNVDTILHHSVMAWIN